MRIPRSIQLHEEHGFIHKYWRCHNREFLLESNEVKSTYMNCTEYALKHKSSAQMVQLHSYCLMDNHTHMQLSYNESSEWLSNFMRISHAKFGLNYNKAHERSGKVANERPKTPLIENTEHLMRVHFYIEANPIRANKIKLEKLKYYKYSSYRFYAHGIKDKWTELLTIPDWYLELGRTTIERQRKYRKLFLEYLQENLTKKSQEMLQLLIGSPLWKEKIFNKIKLIIKDQQALKPLLNTT